MSDPNPLTVPDAGWYPDRNDASLLRWWDGGQWTDNTHSLAAEAVSVEQPVDISAFGLTDGAPVIPEPEPVAEHIPEPEPEPIAAAPVIPPGWYPDYHDTTIQRWWDGRGWTAHTAPLVAEPVVPAAAAEPAADTAIAAPASAPVFAPAPPITNSIVVRGFILSLVSLVINPLLVPSILGLVFGIQGLRRAPQFAPEAARRGMAIATIIISAVSILLSIFWVVAGISVYLNQHTAIDGSSTTTSAIG